MTDPQQLGISLPSAQPPTTVDGYQFEPIKGYPMLRWKGKRPFTSTQYYPAQLKEVHGAEIEGWRSKIYWGDNLQVMSHLLKEFRGRVKLVYIDPPFDSKADYKKRIKLRGLKIENNLNSFEEKQYTDIWTNDEYLQFMYERLILIREFLDETGLLFLHCDPSRGHYLKCILDEIFGQSNFVNQIVWKRSDSHNDVGQGAKHLGTIHDMILAYSKSSEHQWNQVFSPLPKSTIENWYKNIEPETGRKYNKADMTGPGGEAKGNPVYEWKGITRAWRYSKSRMEELDKQGRIVYSSSGTPYLKRYLDESKGIPLQDWWDDIQMIRGIQRRDLAHYPTEKPEELLERIIKVGSSSNDLVLDCFMGSGTTQAVAMKLGRRFIGADINLGAIQITTKRLLGVAEELANQAHSAKVVQLPIPQSATELRSIDGSKNASLGDDSRATDSGGNYSTAEDEVEAEFEQSAETTTYYTGFEVYNVNHYDVFRNPLEAKDLLLEALEVNRLNQGNLFDGEMNGRMIKIMPVDRIATRADLNELIAGFDYKGFEKRYQEHPHAPAEKITLVCMGHEPDLAAQLKREVKPFELDVEVVDILRDKQEIQFKRDPEASIVVQGSELVIEAFYPMNLLGKLSLQQENVEDWRELVESVMIDWNYDGAIFQPLQVDIPSKNELVSGRYPIPDDAGTIRIKITDLLSESLEVEVEHG